MRVITWDTEIAKPLPSREDGSLDWDAAKRGECGISVVCLHDTVTGRTHVYDGRCLRECAEHLNKADLLIGFNSIGYDTPVFQRVSGSGIVVPQFDVLKTIWRYVDARWATRPSGYGLGPTCERTLGIKKVDTGEHAPTLFQRGDWGKLVDYCINDVHLTRMLHNHISEEKYIVAHDKSRLELPDWPEEYA